MRKTIKKYLVSILGALSALCIVFGGVFSAKKNDVTIASADAVAMEWSLGNGSPSASYDSATGISTFSNATWDWLHYSKGNTAVKLDGLTLTLGASHQVSGARFGLAFTSGEPTTYPLNSTDNVKLYIEYNLYSQVRLFFDNDHDRDNNKNADQSMNTLTYLDPHRKQKGFSNAGGPCEAYVSNLTGSYEYTLTFKYEGLHSSGNYSYWSITIEQTVGSSLASNPLTVYLLDGQIAPFSGKDATAYLSAWGFSGNYSFYTKVTEKTQVQKYLDEYNVAKASGNEVEAVALRRQALDMIATLPADEQAAYQTQLDTIDEREYRWVIRDAAKTNEATFDANTGHTQLRPLGWGGGYTYKDRVTLDGLTVELGSDNHKAQSRFGFGLAANMGDWTPDAKTVNFTMIPHFSEFTNNNLGTGKYQDGLFVYDTHAADQGVFGIETILYMDENCTQRGIYKPYASTLNYFVSYEAENTAYKITFNKSTNTGNWKITIELTQGSPYGATEVVAYMKNDEVSGLLDAKGQCYLTAWAANEAIAGYPFYVEVRESSYTAYTEKEAALEKYEAAIRKGATEEELNAYKAAFEATFNGLSIYDYEQVTNESAELESVRAIMVDLTHATSITLNEGLTLNYKLGIPQEVLNNFGSITVETILNSGTEDYGTIEEVYDVSAFALKDGKWVCTIGQFGPQWMTATMDLHCVALDQRGELLFERMVDDYSMKSYCEAILNSTTSSYLKTLVADLLNYGAAAQAYANRNVDTPANAGIDSTLSSKFSDVDVKNDIQNALSVTQSSMVTFTSISAYLEDQVTLQAKFSCAAAYSDIVAQIVKPDGSVQTITHTDLGNGKYLLQSPALTPLQFDEVYTFRVYERSTYSSESAACSFSVNTYVKRNYQHEKAGELVQALYLYGVSANNYAVTMPTNRLVDAGFENNIKVYKNTNSNNATVSGALETVNTAATPTWVLAQWDSKYDITQGTDSNQNGVFTFADTSKSVVIDTNYDTLELELNAEYEYTDGLYQSGDGWAHLLLQQDFYGENLIRLADQSSLNMRMDYTITKCDAKATGMNSNIHTAQFVWYITLQNRNADSEDFGKYIWFGLLLYDNRYEGVVTNDYSAIDAGKVDATRMMICQPSSSKWSSLAGGVSPRVGDKVSINLNILSLAQEAFLAAQQDATNPCLTKTKWEDLYIGSTNFGFEVPGTYNVGVKISNLGLIASRNLNVLPAQNVQ